MGRPLSCVCRWCQTSAVEEKRVWQPLRSPAPTPVVAPVHPSAVGRRRSDEGQGATAGVRDAGLRQLGKQQDRGVRVPVDAGACVGVGTLADGLLRRSQRGLGGSVQGQAAEDRPPMVNPPALPCHTFPKITQMSKYSFEYRGALLAVLVYGYSGQKPPYLGPQQRPGVTPTPGRPTPLNERTPLTHPTLSVVSAPRGREGSPPPLPMDSNEFLLKCMFE